MIAVPPYFVVILYCLLAGLRFVHWYQARKACPQEFTGDPHVLDRVNNPLWAVSCALVVAMVTLDCMADTSEKFPFFRQTPMALPPWLQWLGAGLAFVALLLLHWAHCALGKFFSANLGLKQDHELISSGPYRWIRHPMYTALISFFLGAALASDQIFVLLASILVSALLLLRVHREEIMLRKRFGDAFVAYSRGTGRLLPPLRGPKASS